jgi:hypothetical protein
VEGFTAATGRTEGTRTFLQQFRSSQMFEAWGRERAALVGLFRLQQQQQQHEVEKEVGGGGSDGDSEQQRTQERLPTTTATTSLSSPPSQGGEGGGPGRFELAQYDKFETLVEVEGAYVGEPLLPYLQRPLRIAPATSVFGWGYFMRLLPVLPPS